MSVMAVQRHVKKFYWRYVLFYLVCTCGHFNVLFLLVFGLPAGL